MGPLTWPGRRLAVQGGLTAAIAAGYFTIGHGTTVFPGIWSCPLVTPLDQRLPFVPWFVIVYASMWLLWWVPAWQATPARFRQFVIAAAVSNAVAFAVFIACRDGPARPSIANLHEPVRLMYEALYAVDPAGNGFPSLHAADTVLVLRSIAGWRGERWYVLWGALVILASVLTRQHALLDVVAGAALAYVVDAVVRGWTRSRPWAVDSP